jgi:hypothetical protein
VRLHRIHLLERNPDVYLKSDSLLPRADGTLYQLRRPRAIGSPEEPVMLYSSAMT